MKFFFKIKRPHNGMTYDELYNTIFEEHNSTEENLLDGIELEHYKATAINLQRMNRITRTYEPNDRIADLINRIKEKQMWMILTEGWCGDSAQIIPAINQMVNNNQNIKLRFLFRDDNLDIMDHYLVNGKELGIPRLVIFNSNGDELAIWGPRPQKATKMVKKWREENLLPSDWKRLLHLWYARDHLKAIEEEFEELLKELVK